MHVSEHLVGTNHASKRAHPQPPRTRAAFHRRLQPPYLENHNVSRSGFLPKSNPMPQSCSRYIGICSITCQSRMYLRTWQQDMTTIMQPVHCDLQSQIPKHRITTRTWTTARYVMYCCVMCRFVMYCLLCDVLLWFICWCHVLLCDVLFCVVMWFIVVQYVVK